MPIAKFFVCLQFTGFATGLIKLFEPFYKFNKRIELFILNSIIKVQLFRKAYQISNE